MRTMAKMLVLFAILFSGTTASAQARLFGSKLAHHGLFLRGDVGFGYMSTGFEDDFKVSGFATSVGGSVGGSIVPNLIIAGHLFGVIAPSPTASFEGESATLNGDSLMLLGIGPQVTYYFMPANVFLSGTVALSRASLSADDYYSDYYDSNSDWGIGTQLGVGKEWWISPYLGIGLAGQFSLSSNRWDDMSSTTWATTLVFSATFN